MDSARLRFWSPGRYSIRPFEPAGQRWSANDFEVVHYEPPKMECDHYDISPTPESDDDMPAASARPRVLQLHDEDAVVAYLLERFELLQQQANKRLAKAWIKAVCPKKQARCPYRTQEHKKNPDLKPRVPEWWPSLSLCKYTEPDHVDKHSRMHLCVHLLRLRPSKAQLNEWNKGLNVPYLALQAEHWTEFLREATSVTILDALGQKTLEPEEKLRQREKILGDIFHVAAAEEAYQKGERDGDDVLNLEPDNEDLLTTLNKRTQSKKRVRDPLGDKALDTEGEQEKRSKRIVGRHTLRKRAVPANMVGKIELQDDDAQPHSRPTPFGRNSNRAGPSRSSKARCKHAKRNDTQLSPPHATGNIPIAHALFVPDTFSHGQIDHSMSSSENSPMTASFCSSQSSQDDMNDPLPIHQAPAQFLGHQEFNVDEPVHQPMPFRVHATTYIPQPYFETVPNTPIFSPTRFEHFPQGNGWPQEYIAEQPLERYPMNMSTQIMPGFAMPVAVSQSPMLPSNALSYAPSPFIDHSDGRSITPASDGHPAYSGFRIVDYGGLPATYRQDYPNPEEKCHPMPFAYPEPTPDANFPPAALPGSVTRGWTGYSSGVGETLVKTR